MPRSRTTCIGAVARAAKPVAVVRVLNRHGQNMKPTPRTTRSRRVSPSTGACLATCTRMCTQSLMPMSSTRVGMTMVTMLMSRPAAP